MANQKFDFKMAFLQYAKQQSASTATDRITNVSSATAQNLIRLWLALLVPAGDQDTNYV